MEIFFYQSPLEVPFATPYSREFFTDKQVLLISNKSEILDEFETHRAAIMEDGITKIIGTKVFVPVAVKAIFLTWLKAEYSSIDWRAKTKFADFRPEVTDELQAFFQQLQIVEKREGGTMQQESPKIIDDDPFATATADASKYVSVGFALIVLISLIFILILMKASGDIKQSQIDYVLNMASNAQAKEEKAEKLHWCGMLATDLFKSGVEKEKEYARRYTQACNKVSTISDVQIIQPQPPSLTDAEKLKIISKCYEPAKQAIDRDSYVFIGKSTFEIGSALWCAKEIWNAAHADSVQKTQEILKLIVKRGEDKKNIACPSVEKIYEFSCQHQKLQAVTEEIKTKFPDCNLTSCPAATTSSGS